MTALLELALSGGALAIGVLVLRVGSNRQMRQHDRIYELSFPVGLEAEAVTRFLTALSGLLPPWWRRWIAQPVVVLETTSVPGSISHRLVVPFTACATVEAALAAHLPSVRYQLTRVGAQAGALQGFVTVGTEYRLNTSGRPLRSEPGELSAGLLASLQPLRGGESVVVQWMLTPAGPVRPAQLADKTNTHINFSFGAGRLDSSEAVTAMKAKQSSPLLLAVGRIAVRAADRDRALAVLRQVESPWHGSRAPGVHLQRRLVSSDAVVKRVQCRSVPLTAFPMTLNVNEASGLIGFPIDLTSVPGLTLGTCRLLPVASLVPTNGTLLGVSTYPASPGRAVCLGPDARTRHLWICGPTGIGKSTLLARMAIADIEAGHCVVVLDPKGDLIDRIAERMPDRRMGDVIMLDAADDERPVGYNPLACTPSNRELVVEQVLGVMRALWKFSWGPRLDDIVRGCLLTLTAFPGMTLAELPALLTDANFRGRLVSKLHDPFGVGSFWATFQSWSRAEQITNTAPALNKFRSFAMRSRLRGVLGQADGAVDFNRIIRDRQVLLVNLAAGKLGVEAAYLLGSLLFAGLWDAVSARAALPANQRSLVAAYLDEFQHLVALPTPAETVLAEGRSYGLALTLAHQHLGQLDRELVQAMSANARSKLVLQASHHDAAIFAKELGSGLTPEDLMGIAAYEAVAACFAAGRTQPPATLALPDLPAPSGSSHDLLERSRKRFGVDRNDVDEAIAVRQLGKRAAPTALGRARRTRP
jgi:hypothetical protein